jgi:voltage-gated cation channel
MEVMEDAVDSTGEDLQPSSEATFIAYIFFLIFIFIGSFFTLNLLVGVIIDNFNRLKKEVSCFKHFVFLFLDHSQFLRTLLNLFSVKCYVA